MSIIAHYYGVIGIFIVIGLNSVMLYRAKELGAYQRQMRIFTPLGSMAIGSIIFTGVIMMAAKHLSFSIENIFMILFSLIIIVLEAKRVKIESSLENYKKMAWKILILEVFVTLSISIWMWI